MSHPRTHYVTTSDGVTVGATVHGQGSPLVLLHGADNDGDLGWQDVLPHLTDRFTCHLLNNRGRALSGDHPDLSVPRLAEDVVEYVDSIGEPTGLVGDSLGANLALLVAAQSDAVDAIVPFEPVMMGLVDEQEEAVMGEAIAGTAELAGQGDLTAAVRAFLGWPWNDEELAVAEDAGYFDAAGRYVPNLLNFLQQVTEADGPEIDDAVAMLGVISVPVLVVKGSDTRPVFADSARFVADHAPNARVHEIRGAGHAVPLTHPEELASTVIEFFESIRQPA
jgi:pimeloyl-ACP methyl ester carboxylesterase